MREGVRREAENTQLEKSNKGTKITLKFLHTKGKT